MKVKRYDDGSIGFDYESGDFVRAVIKDYWGHGEVGDWGEVYHPTSDGLLLCFSGGKGSRYNEYKGNMLPCDENGEFTKDALDDIAHDKSRPECDQEYKHLQLNGEIL